MSADPLRQRDNFVRNASARQTGPAARAAVAPFLVALSLVACGNGGRSAGAPAPSSGQPGTSFSLSGEVGGEGASAVLSGDMLYARGPNRGLQILEVANGDRPRWLARVPISGLPLELYRHGDTAIVVTAWGGEWLVCGKCPGGARLQVGGRITMVDVTEPAAPVVRAQYEVRGRVVATRLDRSEGRLVLGDRPGDERSGNCGGGGAGPGCGGIRWRWWARWSFPAPATRYTWPSPIAACSSPARA